MTRTFTCQFFLNLGCMYLFSLHACICTTFMPDAHRGREVPDLLEVKLLIAGREPLCRLLGLGTGSSARVAHARNC